MMMRGEGQYLYDENNVRYLDAYNNVAHGKLFINLFTL
jgi:4-aminobutyrate aminotransferase-like enzyme